MASDIDIIYTDVVCRHVVLQLKTKTSSIYNKLKGFFNKDELCHIKVTHSMSKEQNLMNNLKDESNLADPQPPSDTEDGDTASSLPITRPEKYGRGSLIAPHQDILSKEIGTVGCFAGISDGNQQKYFLITCGHVIMNLEAEFKDSLKEQAFAVHLPDCGIYVSCRKYELRALGNEAFVIIGSYKLQDGRYAHVDIAAIPLLNPDTNKKDCSILLCDQENNAVKTEPCLLAAADDTNQIVEKWGAKTGITGGRIIAETSYDFRAVLKNAGHVTQVNKGFIASNVDKKVFAECGDSGALVIDDICLTRESCQQEIVRTYGLLRSKQQITEDETHYFIMNLNDGLKALEVEFDLVLKLCQT